jgi:hypothetical protein
MNSRRGIVALLLLAAAFTAGHMAGGRAEKKRRIRLHDEISELRNRTAAQDRLIADRGGIDWDTLKAMDPIGRKHMIIALWYANQDAGTYYLGLDTGHQWGPVWNRRSPLSILEEQADVMRAFLADLRKLEEASPYPPRYPTENDVDPRDGSLIDWEDFIEARDDKDPHTIWFGKSRKRGDWMAYEYGKGVYEPDADLLERFTESRNRAQDQQDPDPFREIPDECPPPPEDPTTGNE